MRLGIDPGITGAIALMSGNKALVIWDMPTYEVVVEKKGKPATKRRTVDSVLLHKILLEARAAASIHSDAPLLVILERQQPNMGGRDKKTGKERKDSAITAFTVGRNYGKLESAVEIVFGADYKTVHPNSWKTKAGLRGKEKVDSLYYANSVLDAGDYLTRKKDSGRAEACLIAFHGA